MNLFLLQAPNSVLGTKIVLNKQSDLILHGAEIVAPTGIVEADIDGLVNHFTQIEKAISDSGSELNSGIDNEASIRLEADQSLAADLSAEKGRIDVILDGSTVDLDQFKEVVDFVQSIDLENDESLLNAVVNINQNIDNAISDFQSADNDILDQLSTLTIYTEEQVNIISSGLEQEIIDRSDAVQGVQNDLNNYKDYTDTTIINLQNNISMGDESLEALLTSSLDQNYSQLSSDISAEVLRATTAEESLANTIANVISNVDPAALDSLSEIVDAFVSADGDLNGAIKDLAKDLAEKLKSEANYRSEADKSLEDGLAAEIADREKQAKEIEEKLASEIKRSEEADKSLETALSTEVSYLVANTDFSKLDSFSETIDAANTVISTTYDSAVEYVVSNRPTMVGFTSAPNGTTTSFDSSVELGTHIVFLNGLMQLEGVDFTVQSVSGGTRVTFTSAPFAVDAINIYGVPSGTQADTFRPIDFVTQS